MLHNIDLGSLLSRTTKLLEQFQKSGFGFYLTGSRWFGHSAADSDYDFFVKDDEEVRQFLLGLGFVQEDSSYKEDILINTVFRLVPTRVTPFEETWDYSQEDLEKLPIVPGCQGFDVQLVKSESMACKVLAQQILKEQYPGGLPGQKVDHARLWNLVVHTVRSLEKQAA